MVRQFFYWHPFDCWYFFATSLAIVSIITIKSVTFYHVLKRLVNIFLVFYCQTYREEGFLWLWVVRTSFANYFIWKYATKHIFYQGFVLTIFQLIFKAVKEDVRILIDVHLFDYICRIAVVVFEGVAVGFRIVVFFVTVLKIHEHFLDLMQDVFLWFNWGGLWIFSIGDRVSEVWNHE